MVNKIWGSFIVIGLLYGFLTGKVEGMNQEVISCGSSSLELFFSMFPMMILWSGIMKIAQEAGILSFLSRLLRPFFSLIFPELKKDDPALQYIASNLTINMLGIHNASTPFGLKAMQCLQKNNPKKDTATKSMITFLVLNTSGVTLIATDILSIRSSMGSISPTDLLLVTILATIINTTLALLMNFYLGRERS
ncbi:MAG: spore maturation protein A [Bacilli bacterium]|nr:spore maturation protein A [Bacilli bacterium]